MRAKKAITILTVFLLVIVTILGPRPVAAQPTVLTQKIWGGSLGDERAMAVTTDRYGNIYVTGTTNSFSPGGQFCPSLSILKYSASGNLVWQKTWFNGSSSSGTGIQVDPAGNIYLTGSVFTTCNGYSSGILLKLDPLGNLVWQKTLSQETDTDYRALAVDSSGNVFVTGEYYNGPAGRNDILIMRYDTDGNLVWAKSWGGSSFDVGYGIVLDSSDNVYITGYTDSFGPSSENLVLLKLNSLGQLQFQRIVGSGNENGQGIGLDKAGNIYVAGNSLSHILLVKFDSSGNSIWQKTWSGTKFDTDTGLAMDPSGNLDIGGYTDSYGAGGTCLGPQTCYDILLMKVDSNGNILSQLVYGVYNANSETTGVADSYGAIVAVGTLEAAPPYSTYPGNSTLATASLPITSAGNSTLGAPLDPTPNTHFGSLYTINGNEAFTASRNQFMITFGNQPRLGFNTSPGTAGSITFNGTKYTNGQYLNITSGTANATASPSAGYRFTGWNATGGLVLSSTTSNTTTVTFDGPGTLTAMFQQVAATAPPSPDYTIYYMLSTIIAAAVAALFAVLFFLQKRKRTPTPIQTASAKPV